MWQMNSIKNSAKQKADLIDRRIIETFVEGKSFKVEAGAGSGKTYSLMEVLKWIQNNKLNGYIGKGQKIACITYTNAAVNVICERLGNENNIVPCTIHSFVWSVIKNFQKEICKIAIDSKLYPDDLNLEINPINKVDYTLGVKYYDNGVLYLFHNDIIRLFTILLDREKFRNILSSQYPVILIDEYQDVNNEIVNKFIEYFIEKETGIQFGFFGDSWQTIYRNNNSVGEINNAKIVNINKVVNFRCSHKIVECLNNIRTDLCQEPAVEEKDSLIKIIHCNDYNGIRRTDGQFSGDLPVEEIQTRVKNVIKKLDLNNPNEKLKVLMLTHRVLSNQQSYRKVLDTFGDGFKNIEDKIIKFLYETVHPLIKALNNENAKSLYEVLGISRPPVISKGDKLKWKELNQKLNNATRGNLFDVIKVLYESKVVPLPDEVVDFYQNIINEPKKTYIRNNTYQDIGSISYQEYKRAIEFLSPNSYYSTDHGVKGEEYDNVLFVISKGWNLYDFGKYLPMTDTEKNVNKDAYERNRNLFYVGCSRARKKLILLITPEVDEKFMKYLKGVFGVGNVISYDNFQLENLM